MSERAKAAMRDGMKAFGELLDAIPRGKRNKMFPTASRVEIRYRLGMIALTLLWRALDCLDKESKDAFDLGGDIRALFQTFEQEEESK